MNVFPLEPAQAACVSRLFQGLADGKPAVAEEELLKAAIEDDVRAFPGGVGETPEQTWGSLFVRCRPAQHVATQRTGACRNVTANRRRRDRRIATRLPVRRRNPHELIGRQKARVRHWLATLRVRKQALGRPTENDQSATQVNSIRPRLSGSPPRNVRTFVRIWPHLCIKGREGAQ